MAHNGAIAYAYPIEGITVDGNLDEWPLDLMQYPIEFVGVGVPATDGADLKAHFRVGYNKGLNTIYIAMEITDQSIMMDTSSFVNWDTHDGVELYIDPDHLDKASSITQYSDYAQKRLTFGAKKSWQGVDLKMKQTQTGRTYEWSIQLDKSLNPGLAIGMDLSVIDKDQDDSYSWVSWGKYAQKLNSATRCGDLVLLEKNTELVDVSGALELSELLSSSSAFPVRFTSQTYPKLQLRTSNDSTGAYKITLPSGNYLLDIPEELLNIDDEFYQIAPNQAVEFTASANAAEAPVLTPRQIVGPDLTPEIGILNNFEASQSDLVDQFIETYRKFYSIPGVSLALIKEGKVVYHQTYGVKSTQTNEPVTDETLFEAASITKPVFGFVVLRLAEKGVIDLDKPLYQYLPFEALEVTPEYKKMTARHVLIHQSGLPNWGVPLVRAPGLEYGYSGEGFEYLKRVVCKITGKDIEQLLDEEVISPLKLYHMEFKDSEELRKVAAIGHQGGDPTNWPIPGEPGMAHSMHTEAYAFSRFAIALLEERGLKPETYSELEKIHTLSPAEYWDSPEYPEGAGLGVHVRTSPFGNVIGHGGNNGDFKCLFEVYQELDMGYVVFTNSNLGDQLAMDLAKFLVEGSGVAETAER
ncbi:MAG: hypothetical protein DHS20C17_26810 [Cyclobacteriaceae bacterium]|nr:MAG: hypothetical protein DHS20C17_26810 [Cyclobacteriaceae bacterium]